MGNSDNVIGYIEYLGEGGMVVEVISYTSAEKFKKESIAN